MLDQLALVPLVVKNFPLFPDCVGANALNPSFAVVAPVPPLLMAIVVPFQIPVPMVPSVVIELCPAYVAAISKTFPVTTIRLAEPVNATAPVAPFTDCTLVAAGEKLTQFASVLAGNAVKI